MPRERVQEEEEELHWAALVNHRQHSAQIFNVLFTAAPLRAC